MRREALVEVDYPLALPFLKDIAIFHPNGIIRKLQVQVGHPAVEKTGSILATVLVEASDSTKIGASAAA